MQRGPIEGAVRTAVVPPDEHAPFWLEQLVDQLEARRPAGIDGVEIGHEGPGPLSGDGCKAVEVLAGRLEIVGVSLELLADLIALALNWLAMSRIDPGERKQPRLDVPHRGLVLFEVAGLARAEG